MLTRIRILDLTVMLALTAVLATGCPERGAALGDALGDADAGYLDCGEHGSAHGDHCHCHMGYLFDGASCVSPGDIGEICDELTDEDVACACPAEGVCHCSGEVVTLEGERYCEPALHG